MRTRLPFALLAALSCSLASVPAHARARTFVASYGNDANACTFGSPCRNFQQAVNVVDPGGEVTAIDSAGFGPILITKAVTITSPNGVEAGIVLVSGGNSITINAGPFDAITLSGLVIDGAGVGTNGILFSDGGYLIMQDCVIRNMTGDGIHFASNFISHLSVTNSFVGHNGGNGILVQPVGSASVTAVFERVRAQYNGANGYGITLDASLTGGSVNGTATDTVSSDNGGGFSTSAGQNNQSNLTVLRSVAANNHTGVQGGAGNSTVFISETTITNNVLPCNNIVKSYQDNTVNGNQNADFCGVSQISKE
jgi:hypothetical protein